MANALVPSVAPTVVYVAVGIPGPSQLTPTLLERFPSKLEINCASQTDVALPNANIRKPAARAVAELMSFRIAKYLQPRVNHLNPSPVLPIFGLTVADRAMRSRLFQLLFSRYVPPTAR